VSSSFARNAGRIADHEIMEPAVKSTSRGHPLEDPRAAIWRVRFPEVLVLAAATLLTVGVMTATHLQGSRDPALLFAAMGAGGMPMISHWTPARCHAPVANSSAVRLNHADLLALLEGK
jgi:amino acid permease